MTVDTPPKTLHYRPDIDGLRAIAVSLVVAYHLDLSLSGTALGFWLGRALHRPAGFISLFPKGGFIGVDIFFVISGYLISGILLRQQASGTLALSAFYERRIRRILPALLAVLLFTFAAAWAGMLPFQMQEFAKSALAATLSCSNLFFLQNANYFDAPSVSQPLLHTWSLSVEEQFYLLFPLILIGIRRSVPRHLPAIILAAAALSFIASVLLLPHHPAASFYLLFTRAWELLLGTLLALGIFPLPRSLWTRNLASCSGLAMILFAGFRFSNQTSFPGAAALLPCTGAALLIAAGITGGSLIQRLLSLRPIVAIGLISYSLYLWHWPLLVANRYEFFAGFHLSRPLLLLLILAVSTASWRFIEQPFRHPRPRTPRTRVFLAAATAIAAFAALNLAALATHGFAFRLTPQTAPLNEAARIGIHPGHWGAGCFANATNFIPDTCLSFSNTQPNDLLYGDSQAAHLWYGLTNTYPAVHFAQATASSCKPLLTSASSPDAFCRQLTETVLHHLLTTHHPDAVILSSIWTEKDVPSLAETVAYLAALHQRVYVIGPMTYYDQPLPALLYRSLRHGDPSLPARHLSYSERESNLLDQDMQHAVLSHGGLGFISLHHLLCGSGPCLHEALPGTPLLFDGIHLTDQGSLLLAARLRQQHLLP